MWQNRVFAAGKAPPCLDRHQAVAAGHTGGCSGSLVPHLRERGVSYRQQPVRPVQCREERVKMDRSSQSYASPCIRCTRVRDPKACENKQCKDWQRWFLDRWALIHNYPREQMETAELQHVGVPLGGRHYAAPHQVRKYLAEDPCDACPCPRDLCNVPCRVRRAWEKAREEVFS